MARVTNRVWDDHKTGSVTWRTEYPDEYGIQYPGPGDFNTQTSDYTLVRGAPVVTGSASLPNQLFNPHERWLLDGNMSGSEGVEDATLSVGSQQYASGPVAGTQAFDFNGSTRLYGASNPAPASLRITGSVSVVLWSRPTNTLGSFGSLMFEIAGESLAGTANNFLYSIDYRTSSRRTRAVYEDISASAHQLHDTLQITASTWHHIAFTRDDSGGAGATVGRLFIDGEIHVQSTTLNPAFDGSNARLRMGMDTNSLRQYTGRLAGVAVYNRALQPAEIMALYKRGLPSGSR